jgi:hypothetical protein
MLPPSQRKVQRFRVSGFQGFRFQVPGFRVQGFGIEEQVKSRDLGL